MKRPVQDSAREYMVTLAEVKAARKALQQAKKKPTPARPAAPAEPAEPALRLPSLLDDAIFCLIGLRPTLVTLKHPAIEQIDRLLRRRCDER